MITSTKNPKIKEIKALQGRAKARRQANTFVVEGVRLAEEAVAAGWMPRLCLYTAEISARGQALVSRLKGQDIPVEEVASHVMEAASDTQTPQGILMVLPLQTLPVPQNVDFALVIDQVRDPGNLGTLLRSAAAAGVQAVLLTEGGVDVFSPKVVRGAMGAHFRLPIQTLNEEDILSFCRQHSLKLLAAAAGEGGAHTQTDLTQPLALMVGGEAEGVSGELLTKATEKIHIPMPGGSESLNAAVAGSILLFEVVRQRGI
jgi:TrmH family RNA methyltransferase